MAEKPLDKFVMYSVYVLKSIKDGRHYIGSTSDLQQRLKSHNAGKVRSTKSRRPFEIVYSEEYDTVTEVRKRELFLKSGQGRNFLKSHLEGWSSG